MIVRKSMLAGILDVAIVGEADPASWLEIDCAVLRPLRGANPPYALLLDLSGCSGFDGSLLPLIGRARSRLDWLGVIGASASTRRLMEDQGMDAAGRVRFFGSREAAFDFLVEESSKRFLETCAAAVR